MPPAKLPDRKHNHNAGDGWAFQSVSRADDAGMCLLQPAVMMSVELRGRPVKSQVLTFRCQHEGGYALPRLAVPMPYDHAQH